MNLPMNINELIGYILVGIASLTLVVVVILMVVQCARNCRSVRSLQRNFMQRANELRINKMLETLGMTTRSYVRKALCSQVKIQLNRCESCTETTKCDAALKQGEVQKATDFCPNYDDLVQLSPQRKNFACTN